MTEAKELSPEAKAALGTIPTAASESVVSTRIPKIPEVQIVPALKGGRPETGAMQFGEDDWPGVFIRGDNAIYFAMAVVQAEQSLPDDQWLLKSVLKGLSQTLRSCAVG